ncbi:C39 family peptidase [Acetilactobacillus jinshanensis]|uniref:Peptidase C39-like domain-containing protein n=1 Tax=Acetilactobacillus jinshanensis TaxID=1720083 RepID=A0A4V1ALH9_9LACO|nr:C39 family peptidase [Acetilactobacillus jinshanensis]QBP17659.1 hypothetical protein ELX58_00330 [Acetilactobacillus jinshanensis]URL61798.1 hypothetical protein HGK75_07625 [uncultured bacterium]
MQNKSKRLISLLVVACLSIFVAVGLNFSMTSVSAANNYRKTYRHKSRKYNHARNSRFMHYQFISQKGRGNANDGCEAASLLMALHHFDLAKHYNLAQFVRTIPRSKDPEKGYTKNPWKLGTGASLYPRALLKVAQRYGAKKSYIIDDYYKHGHGLYGRKASANAFRQAILKGYPVVFEGCNHMQFGTRTNRRGYNGYRSDRVMLIYGYRNHRFYWTDPDQWYNRPGNTPEKAFMNIINAPIRGPRAVAIGK